VKHICCYPVKNNKCYKCFDSELYSEFYKNRDLEKIISRNRNKHNLQAFMKGYYNSSRNKSLVKQLPVDIMNIIVKLVMYNDLNINN
jgi:hypothetical protein